MSVLPFDDLWYQGDGDGTFSSPKSFLSVAGAASPMVAVDFNNDGFSDFISVFSSSTDKLYLYNPSLQNFDPPIDLEPTVYNSRAIAVGYINDDLNSDLIIGIRDGVARVYLGDGVNNFFNIYNLGSYTTFNTIHNGLYDFDNDGDLDYIETYVDGDSQYFANNGDGTFEVPSAQIFPGTDYALDLAVGDIDNDGDLDIVFGRFLNTYDDLIFRNDY